MKKESKVDVVTIGVGWTGGVIAAECGKAGLSVVGLERGINRSIKDYYNPHDEIAKLKHSDLFLDLSTETTTTRKKKKDRALPERDHVEDTTGTGVGGDGAHWSAKTFRFLEYDFEIRSKTEKRYGEDKIPKDMTLQDWGITYDELEPYYVKTEEMMGVGGNENPLGPKRSNDFPNPPMKETPMTKKFKNVVTEMDYHPYLIPSALASETYTNPDGETINACQYCGFCDGFGCEHNAKAEPRNTVLKTAEKTGNYTLRTNCHVTKILHDGKKATGVIYVDTYTGEEIEQPAEVVVVTSGLTNNVRLLLNSELGVPYDSDNGKGVIGKNFCNQYITDVTGFFEDEKFNVFMGSGALGTVIDDFNGDNFDHSDLDFLHGAEIHVEQEGLTPISANPLPPDTPSWGKEYKNQSIKYFNQHIIVRAQHAELPFKDNYFDLDPNYKDVYGYPLLRITQDLTENAKNMSEFLAGKSEEIMKKMGADQYSPSNFYMHKSGGAIMGDDPETSAVNSYMQMWDHENVFVPGASALPHHPGYNPTLTICALTYRAAEGIEKYIKDGGMLE